jgi:hypothetical protein
MSSLELCPLDRENATKQRHHTDTGMFTSNLGVTLKLIQAGLGNIDF